MRRVVIRNTSRAELGVMLEPWTDRENVKPGGSVAVEGDFSDDEITIDHGEDNFLSIWCPPGCKLRKIALD